MDFIIKFTALVNLSKMHNDHAIFLLKKHVNKEIIRTIMGFPPPLIPTNLNEWVANITSVGKGFKVTDSNK